MILSNVFHLATFNRQNSILFKFQKNPKARHFKVEGFQNKKVCEVLLIYKNFENSL